MWIDEVQRVGSFAYRDPLTKRYKVANWRDTEKIEGSKCVKIDRVCPDNELSEIHKFEDVLNEEVYERTFLGGVHNDVLEDSYRDVTITKVKPIKGGGFGDREFKNY